MAATGMPGGIQMSQVSPAYLHGNSTSHTWVFSAIAELIDNAYDPNVNATELRINKKIINDQVCLTFVDNGSGMTPDKLHKMLSFGYCQKDEFSTKLHQAIGQYGNGFKSGSMRLGKDAIVFTKHADSMSLGMLSQTYLTAINAETVLTPIVTWTLLDKRIEKDDANSSLEAICDHSLFKTENSLLEELHEMRNLRTGTKIIIYNLKRSSNDDILELDFNSDPTDIRNPETHKMDFSTIDRDAHEQTSAYVTSLREYCSILYLWPRMKIVLRDKMVKTKLIQKSLSRTEIDVYKPSWAPKRIPITFGFNSQNNPNDYGIMLYHKNRLIRAYEKVGYQKQPNELGVGVVGVVDANFLTPIHNKQDFVKDGRCNAFMNNMSQKLNDYWNEKMRTRIQPQQTPQEVERNLVWAQCNNCLKWRKLPIHIREDDLPDEWFCYMNPDEQFNCCDIDQEKEDESEVPLTPTYKKTFKKLQKEKKLRLKIKLENRYRAKELALQAKEHKLQQMEREINKRSETQIKAESELTEVTSTSSKEKKERFCLKTNDGDVVAEIPLESNPVPSPNLVDILVCYNEDENSAPSSVKKPRITSTSTTKEAFITPDTNTTKKSAPCKRYKDTGMQTELSVKDISGIQQKAEECERLQSKMFDLFQMMVPEEDVGTLDGVEELLTEMINRSQPSS